MIANTETDRRLRIVIALAIMLCGSCHSQDDSPISLTGPTHLMAESAAAANESAGWPRLYGPRGDSTASGTLSRPEWEQRPPEVLWSRDVGTGYSSPVVANGRLILRHRKGNVEILECFQSTTGKSLWSNETPTTFRCRYEYSSGPYSTPTIDGDRVYSMSAQGLLQCCRLDDGKPVWERNLAEMFEVEPGRFAVGTSPLIEDDLVIVAIGGRKKSSSVIALNKDSGKVVWTGGEGKGTMATPRCATIHGKRYLFVLLDAGLFALNPETGRELWRVPFHQSNPEKVVATSPAVSGDLVLVTGFSLGSLCVRVLPDGTFEKLWQKRRNLDSQYQNLICIRQFVFGFASRDRTLRCLDMATGDVRWKWKSETGVGASIAVGDRMLVLTERGRLACFQINTKAPTLESITSEALLEYPVFTSPAFDANRLFVRNEKRLICLRIDSPRTGGDLAGSATTQQNLIKSSQPRATVLEQPSR